MMRKVGLTIWAIYAWSFVFGQANTLIRNNTLDFLMATTTFGIEHHLKNKISLQLNLGYTYAERFGIYDARDLRGGVIDIQARKYLSKTETNLSGIYIGFSAVHRFAYYTTDQNYYVGNVLVSNPNVRVSARYTSFGAMVGYQWEILKGKLFWDNYVGICGRIGSGYQRDKYVTYYALENAIIELYYSGAAPKFGTALCVAIR